MDKFAYLNTASMIAVSIFSYYSYYFLV